MKRILKIFASSVPPAFVFLFSLCFFLFPISFAHADITTGLQGWWKMDEASSGACSGTTADSSGSGNTGTCVSNPTYAAGKIGTGALSFDGSSNYINAGTMGTFGSQMANPLTVSFWIYRTTGSESTVLGEYSNYSSQNLIDVEVNEQGYSNVAGALYAFMDDLNGKELIASTASTPVPLNAWTHVVIVISASANTVAFYVNGVLQTTSYSQQMTPTSFENLIDPLYIGALDDSSSAVLYKFGGSLDDVRVYNRALTSSDVTQLYEYTAPLTTGLVGWWKMDEASSGACSGTTADSSGNGNTGTCNSSPTYVAGKIGTGALNFDGSSQYVSVPNQSLGDFTFSMWDKWTGVCASDPGNNISLFDSDNYPTSPRNKVGIKVCYGSTPEYLLETYVGGTGAIMTTGTPDTNWHLVTVVRSGTSVSLYVDGSAVGTSVTVGSATVSLQNIVFGQHYYSGGNHEFFPGSIDDVRIYNRALSANDVSALYAYPKTRIFLTSGSTWTVPSDWNSANNTIEVIGGGGGGGIEIGGNPGDGGGGGGYSLSTNVSLTPNATVGINIGAGGGVGGAGGSGANGIAGGDTYLCSDNSGNCSDSSGTFGSAVKAGAHGGGGGYGATWWLGGGGGGSTSGAVGNTPYAGGDGGNSTANWAGGGGGGAAGLNGAGVVGQNAGSTNYGVAGGNGDNNLGGAGGAAGTGEYSTASNGGNGTEWGSYGSGGGGATTGYGGAAGNGGNYGGGGGGGAAGAGATAGSGAPGVIVITYTPGGGGGGGGITASPNSFKIFNNLLNVTSGLVGWWKMDEASSGACSGASLVDSSGNGYTGTCTNGATWVSGKIGVGALSFNSASSQKIDVSSSAAIMTGSAWSVAFWLRENYTTPRAEMTMYGEGDPGGGFAYISSLPYFSGTEAGYLRFGVDDSPCGSNAPVSNDIVSNDGTTWQHWVVTYSGTTVTYYLNGAYDGSGTCAYAQSTNHVAIGALNYNGSSAYAPINGYLDDVRVYNRALSPTEVKTLYNYPSFSGQKFKVRLGGKLQIL